MTSPEQPPLEPELEDRLRRGLAVLAAETPASSPVRRSRRAIVVSVAAGAAVVAAGIAIAVDVGRDGSTASPRAAQSPPASATPPPIGIGVTYDLHRLATESGRIVVGTVTAVEHHAASDASGGLPYVLADVDVSDTLKGSAESRVVAFDYEYGSGDTVSDGAQGASFTVGMRVLLFLSDSTGTVHQGIKPPHWQVTGGSQGEYQMRGNEPEAPFTLEDVQHEIG